MANNVDRLSRNVHRIVERADIQIPPAPKFPVEAVTGPAVGRMAAVARFNGDLQKWRNDRWSVDAPFVTEAELSRSVTKVSDDQALLTQRFDVSLQDLSDLEARVTALETTVTTLDERVTVIESTITTIDSRVTILESEIGTAVPHTILDAVVHTDSVTQTVTRGGLIYGNATLKWDLLTIGVGATYLRSGGTDVAWSSVVATEITGTLGVDHGGTGATTLTGIIQGTGIVPLTGITGTGNYFPKWSAAAPFLTSTSLLFDDGSFVGVGEIVPLTRLHVTASDAATVTVTDALRLNHLSSATPGVAFGTGLLFTGKSDTTADRTMARIQSVWSIAADATRAAALQFQTGLIAAMTTQMQLNSAGVLSIGLTNPTATVIETTRTTQVDTGATSFIRHSMAMQTSTNLASNDNMGEELAVTLRHNIGVGNRTVTAFVSSMTYVNQSTVSFTSGAALVSIDARALNDSATKTVDNTISVRAQSGASRVGGTVTNAIAFQSTLFASGAIGSGYGFYAKNPASANIANLYGVYVEAMTTATSQNYGIYVVGTQSYFGGAVGIGVTVPISQLHVRDNVAATATVTTAATVDMHSTGTPAAGFGSRVLWRLESSTTIEQDAAALVVTWTTATHANRTSVMSFWTTNNAAAMAAQMVLSGAGGLSVGDATLTTLPVGVINAFTGFRANNAAPLAQFLRGDGTNFVASAIQLTDLPAGSGVTFADPSALIGMTMIPGVATTAMRSDGAPAIDPNIAPTWTNGHTFNMGTTPTLAAISIDIAATGAPGTRDSHSINWIGRSDDGAPHAIGWRQWIDVTTNAGASFFTLESNLDAGTYLSRLNVYSTGLVEVPSFNIGVTQSDTYGIVIANTQAAAAGAANQQWSGPLRFEGQGWKTDAVAGTMKAEFRQYIAPVQGTAAPTVYWVMEHSVNDVAYTEILRADSTGFVRVLKNAIGDLAQNANSELGLKLVNETLAIAGTQQQSPAFTQTGSGYHTTTGAGPETLSFRQQVVPVEGTSATNGYLRIDSKVGGGSYTATNALVLYSGGGLSLGAVHLVSAIPTGVISTQVGYRIAGAAPSAGPPAHFLKSNGTNFIDGTIAVGDLPAGTPTGFANPTASVGLTVVNGVATTAMRSDAAPPLSVAIVPTWTGRHIWSYPGLGVTPDDTKGISLVNTTAAALGAQQISPSFAWRGKAWQTSDGSSHAIDMRAYLFPIQDSSPKGYLKFERGTDGAAYQNTLWIDYSFGAGPAVVSSVDGFTHWSDGDPTSANNESIGIYKSPSGGAIIEVGFNGTGVARELAWFLGGASVMRLDPFGFLRIGDNAAPSSDGWFQVGAGTSAIAPIKLTSGVNLTTPTAGALEYDGNLYTTKVNNVRLGIGGSLVYSTTQTGNTALTETDLFTTSIAAGTGSANGASIDFVSSGTFATSISTDKRIRAYWAGVLIFDSGALAITSTSDWALYVEIIRVDATNFKAVATLNTSSASLSAYADYTTGASTWANANTLKITGQGTSLNDVVGEFWKVDYKV